ncbi:MAG: GNAT family N-acetyltransferase [Candidatus Melainabacteria bacterium]|nr:GNAT family N-acetyltransferase [Candidatus Melainabacteria bacterium]
MTQPYFLQTERLGFRHWRHCDQDLALSLWGDPEVTRLFSKEPLDADMVEKRLLAEIDNQDRLGFQYWPVFLKSDNGLDEHAGCCGLKPYGDRTDVFELGFHLRPAYWGQGLAGEAARAVIDYSFGVLGARALFAGHHPDNTASQKVLKKLGFVETGTELFEGTGLLHPAYLLSP